MDNPNYTTKHRKGQHLTAEERNDIEVHLKDRWSVYKIAKHLRRPYNTIKNEIKRGTVSQYQGRIDCYKSSAGHAAYLLNRTSCRKQYKRLAVSEFIRYVVANFRSQGWSLDACAGRAIADGKFSRDNTVCTKTLYNYVDLGLLTIKNIDLPEKLRRNTKAKKVRENKRILGTSIEERPESIQNRLEFGHWEIDTVVGSKNENDRVVMTLVERKTRYCIWVIAENHTADAIQSAIQEVLDYFDTNANKVFMSITSDNGSEFARLSELENGKIKVYFTHPYSSWEKGTNECHNRMLRRFIPKGKCISNYKTDDTLFMADMMNGLPRKLLHYMTPDELFDKELDRLYAA